MPAHWEVAGFEVLPSVATVHPGAKQPRSRDALPMVKTEVGVSQTP